MALFSKSNPLVVDVVKLLHQPQVIHPALVQLRETLITWMNDHVHRCAESANVLLSSAEAFFKTALAAPSTSPAAPPAASAVTSVKV